MELKANYSNMRERGRKREKEREQIFKFHGRQLYHVQSAETSDIREKRDACFLWRIDESLCRRRLYRGDGGATTAIVKPDLKKRHKEQASVLQHSLEYNNVFIHPLFPLDSLSNIPLPRPSPSQIPSHPGPSLSSSSRHTFNKKYLFAQDVRLN